MDRRQVIIALGLATVPGLARAAAKPPVKLSRVFPFLDKYLAIPPAERNRFTVAYTFQMNGKPAAGLTATILEADGRRTPITIGADGRVARLPTAAQLASASFVAEVPADAKMGIQLSLEPLAAPALEYSAHDLDLSLAQANAGMSRAAGLIALALPKLSGVTFQGGGGGRARLGDGREQTLPLDAGAPFYDPRKIPGATTLTLARLPTRVSFKGG